MLGNSLELCFLLLLFFFKGQWGMEFQTKQLLERVSPLKQRS